MCGRFTLDVSKKTFQKRFGIAQLEIELTPRYNVCPGMFLPTVIRQSSRSVVLMKWGLVPSWSKDINIKFSNINARAETITTSPAYRHPFEKNRCLIPATGFYEWAKLPDNTRLPYYFHTQNPIFSFAGIWDVWKDAEEKEFFTCAIITTVANGIVGRIHPRMPVILDEKDESTWIDPVTPKDALLPLLQPASDDIIGHRISTRVNNPRTDDPGLTEEWNEPFGNIPSVDSGQAG